MKDRFKFILKKDIRREKNTNVFLAERYDKMLEVSWKSPTTNEIETAVYPVNYAETLLRDGYWIVLEEPEEKVNQIYISQQQVDRLIKSFESASNNITQWANTMNEVIKHLDINKNSIPTKLLQDVLEKEKEKRANRAEDFVARVECSKSTRINLINQIMGVECESCMLRSKCARNQGNDGYCLDEIKRLIEFKVTD